MKTRRRPSTSTKVMTVGGSEGRRRPRRVEGSQQGTTKKEVKTDENDVGFLVSPPAPSSSPVISPLETSRRLKHSSKSSVSFSSDLSLEGEKTDEMEADEGEGEEEQLSRTMGALPGSSTTSVVDGDPAKPGLTRSKSLPARLAGRISSRSSLYNRKSKVKYHDKASWKASQGYEDSAGVVMISGPYPCVRKVLGNRGWAENKDRESPWWDMKWTLKTSDIEFKRLESGMLVNHFPANYELTTKYGLCKNMRSLSWSQDADPDEFFPRCFDLSEANDRDDFLDYFHDVSAVSLLRRWVSARQSIRHEWIEKRSRELATAYSLALSRANALEKIYPELEPRSRPGSGSGEEDGPPTTVRAQEPPLSLPRPKEENIAALLSFVKSAESDLNTILPENEAGKDGKREGEGRSRGPVLRHGKVTVGYSDFTRWVENVLDRLSESDVQYGVSGDRNVWIVKPAEKSRGRGIQCYDDLSAILGISGRKEERMIAQKYLESPLLIHRRKFDIRQWVLVTSWEPLTVWFYEESYLRFSSKVWSLSASSLKNRGVHLCNNAVQSKLSGYGDEIEGNMWHVNKFIEHIGKEVWEEDVRPGLERLVKLTLMSVTAEDMKARSGCFELFGFDFMIDSDMKPWLIEVNSSPTLQRSTPLMKELVPKLLTDVFKIVLDHPLGTAAQWMKKRRGGKESEVSAKPRDDVETGSFTLLHRGPRVNQQVTRSLGKSLLVSGSSMTLPPRRQSISGRLGGSRAKAVSSLLKPVAAASLVVSDTESGPPPAVSSCSEGEAAVVIADEARKTAVGNEAERAAEVANGGGTDKGSKGVNRPVMRSKSPLGRVLSSLRSSAMSVLKGRKSRPVRRRASAASVQELMPMNKVRPPRQTITVVPIAVNEIAFPAFPGE